MASHYFGFVDGKPYDFFFRKVKHSHLHSYDFHLGPHKIGRVFKSGHKPGWGCFPHGQTNEDVPRIVEGFVSRHAAVDYLLKACPLTAKTYNK